jgi:hypothetical protein
MDRNLSVPPLSADQSDITITNTLPATERRSVGVRNGCSALHSGRKPSLKGRQSSTLRDLWFHQPFRKACGKGKNQCPVPAVLYLMDCCFQPRLDSGSWKEYSPAVR